MEPVRWVKLKITFFDLERHWGFCGGEDKIFFHVRDFRKLHFSEPPPILGETVLAQVQPGSRGFFAKELQRDTPPLLVEGRVRSFDSAKGWGFVERVEKIKYVGPLIFLHRSDIAATIVPTIGQKVAFYMGESKNRPRACWPEFEVVND